MFLEGLSRHRMLRKFEGFQGFFLGGKSTHIWEIYRAAYQDKFKNLQINNKA